MLTKTDGLALSTAEAAVLVPEVAPAIENTFASDLESSKAIVKTDIGQPCDSGDPTWLTDHSNHDPTLAPVAGTTPDGECQIIGWSYTTPHHFDFPLPTTPTGYTLQPIFDNDGQLLTYFAGGPDTQLPNGPDN